MLSFVLTPDSLTSLAVRRELATHNKTGIKVGTFSGLLELLAELWLLPAPTIEWQSEVRQAALAMPDAFWAASIKKDEAATLAEITASLELLLQSLPLSWQPSSGKPLTLKASTNPRLKSYFEDIATLCNNLSGKRPMEQLLARDWLLQANTTPIETIALESLIPLNDLPLWQREVVEKLQLLTPNTETIFTVDEFNKGRPDEPSFLSARDVIAECESIASMVQTQIEHGCQAEQLAIMLPSHLSEYGFWLSHFLSQAGIAVSNYQETQQTTDWQKQLLKDLLHYIAADQPAMQLQSILVNPLMPWTRAKGQYYAQRFTRYENNPKWIDESDDKEFIKHLLYSEKLETNEQLFAWLNPIILETKALPFSVMGKARMQELLQELQDKLSDNQEASLKERITSVLSSWQVELINKNVGERHYLNAVTLLSAEQRLSQPVERLWVAGFNQGAYDEPTPNSGAIPFECWQNLQLNFANTTQKFYYPHSQFTNKNWLDIWLQTLSRSKQNVIITNARQGFDGKPLYLSDIWLNLAQKYGKKLDAETFMQPIEKVKHELLRWENIELKPLEQSNQTNELNFEENVFALNEELTGKVRAESPSSLEKLLISPFDWLLNRLNIESKEWEPQELSPALQGNIAHKVFELYKGHQHEGYSDTLFRALFEQAITAEAPFMNQAFWRIEKANLMREIQLAFEVFANWLANTDWLIAEAELLAEGKFESLDTKGFIDAVLKHPEQTLILDYKKSKSNDRIKRLEKGFDVQTAIYRKLYNDKNKDTVVITGYFNLNDRKMVTDTPMVEGDEDWIKAINTALSAQSEQALALIRRRLEDLRQGKIAMSHPDMGKEWNKVGITAYSLENNILVKRFMNESAEKELGGDK